jgi:small subunit ribosomal protein S9
VIEREEPDQQETEAAAQEPTPEPAAPPAEQPTPEAPAAEAPAQAETPPAAKEAPVAEEAPVAPEAPPDASVPDPAPADASAPDLAGADAPAPDAPAPDAADTDAAEPAEEEQPLRRLAELAADARYFATGKRKSSVARVIIRPGSGQFNLNGRVLEEYFPRRTHQAVVRQPLDVAGYGDRVDVRARIHGGGISGQADAVRHGIAKALIEADPALRGELKRRQLLTRDPRVKERKKAGLKKARKRPQFSKR